MISLAPIILRVYRQLLITSVPIQYPTNDTVYVENGYPRPSAKPMSYPAI
jgi:hypothetical protein